VKKAWKWALTAAALPVACIALLWIDSYYRAVAAIRAEDERLASDIAAFRSQKRRSRPVELDRLLAKMPGDTSGMKKRPRALPCPTELFLNSDRPQLDQGHSGCGAFYKRLFDHCLLDFSPSILFGNSEPPPNGDQVVTALSVTHALAQECGYHSRCLLLDYEHEALRALRDILAGDLSPAEIRRILDELDRALAARPTFVDTLDAEYLMNRAEVLRVLHLKADPTGFIARKPGWREFFSWRILLVKALTELGREYEVLRPVAEAPDAKLERAVELLAAEQKVRLTQSALRSDATVRRMSDDDVRRHWLLARTATVIALFRAERGRDIKRLEELVPEVLPQIPADPVNGEPVELKDGILKIRFYLEPVSGWDVRRK
jgi:hypothetical protein